MSSDLREPSSGVATGEVGGGTAPLAVYVRTRPLGRLGWKGRLFAGGLSAACLTVLVLAAWVSPDGRGVGTHEQLGLSPCGMMMVWGLPCPTCGYTTSFSLFVRGRWLASVWNQPAGFVGAMVAALTAWGGLLAAWRGWRAEVLISRWFTSGMVVSLGALILLAWVWKMVLVRVGG